MKIEIQASGESLNDAKTEVSWLLREITLQPDATQWQVKSNKGQASAVVVQEEKEGE
jgi:hypothetical protein